MIDPPARDIRAPVLTIAIPFRSGRDYLVRAIESALAQDDDAWIGFVCDNQSPEPGVEALVKDVGRGRLGYVRNDTNLGMVGNFNRCLELATTDLVTLLHSDDELVPDYVRVMRDAARRHPDAAAFFCRAEIIGPDGRPRFSLADVVKDRLVPTARPDVILEGETGVRAVLRANFIPAPSLCFRKSVLGERRFTDRYAFVLDWELTTQLLLDGKSLVGVPGRHYRYRRHDETTTEKLTRSHVRYREESEFYDRMQAAARARGWDRCARVAEQKRIVKLQVTYRALKSLALLQFADAYRGAQLLRRL